MHARALCLIALVGCAPAPTADPRLADLDALALWDDADLDLAGRVLLLPLRTMGWALRLDACAPRPCPSVVRTETRVVLTGDCVDDDGGAWDGQLVLDMPTEDQVLADFDDFGLDGALWVDGRVDLDLAAQGVDLRATDLWVEVEHDAGDHPSEPPGLDVSRAVRFVSYELLADADGAWSIQATAVLAEPQELLVMHGSGHVTDEVLSGEVWTLSTQPEVLQVHGTPEQVELRR